ncbi:MAG: hypothetical protein AAB540_01515, partial [Patescibacteria group bacterium]
MAKKKENKAMSQTLIETKRELDEARATLQAETEEKGRLEAELAACKGELANLRKEAADKGQTVRDREVTLAEMERKIQRLGAEIEVRDDHIENLNVDIETLRAADPVAQAEAARQITAEAAKDAETRENQQTKKLQLTGVVIAAAVTILVFAILWFFGIVEIINYSWLIGGVTAAAMFAAFMIPIAQTYVEKMEAKNQKTFRWIGYALCLAIGSTIALLGKLEGAPWLVFAATAVTAVGFAIICNILWRCAIVLDKEDGDIERKKKMAWVLATLIGGLIMGAIVQIVASRFVDNHLGASGYLLGVIIGTLSLGAFGIVGILLGFTAKLLWEVFSAMLGNITTFFKSLKKRREEGG